MPTITLAELRPGDIIISFHGRQDDAPNVAQAALWARHASIVAGTHESGAVFQVHNTNDGMRGANRNFNSANPKWSGTIRNDVAVPKADNLPAGNATGDQLRVLRCKQGELAARAAKYSLLWDAYEIPYSEGRLAKAKAHEQLMGSNDRLVKEHRWLFSRFAKFRAIKYAARRNGFLCYPDGLDNDPGLKHGMFCSQLVAICYQVAGLESVVNAAPPSSARFKVTDKGMSPNDLVQLRKTFSGDTRDLDRYAEYSRHLNSHDPYELHANGVDAFRQKEYRYVKSDRLSYAPSFAFWKQSNGVCIEDFPWADHITKGMMLDSKTIMPTGLYACLTDDSDGWEDKGFLVGDRFFSETAAEKQLRLRHKAELVDDLRATSRWH